jgi:hypothetical protein
VNPAEVSVARAMWAQFEPIHAVTYFAPEPREHFAAAGLKGFWRGYFAGRAAPLGEVDAAPVVTSFFSFAPSMVERALPDIWQRATPKDALDARLAGAVAALNRLWDGTDEAALAPVADRLEQACSLLDYSGRLLGAANAVLPWPSEPVGRMWHACTVLREHRGDGHIAALTGAGIDGCEVLVWRAALDLRRELLQPARGWTDDEWDDAQRRLIERGWLDGAGQPTARGTEEWIEIEASTDRDAGGPWQALSGELDRLVERLTPLADAAAAELPPLNPIGLPGRAGGAAV